ncbi:hypothetical protein ACA910_006006 [Epithemia clementina (nom. ined.)]
MFGTAALATRAQRAEVDSVGDVPLVPRTNRTTIFNAGEVIVDPASQRKPMKVLFLSADTGGGHRASAESLAKQFLLHYPGSTYDLLDIWTDKSIAWPYRSIVNAYKHLSAHPRQWKFLYHLSNSRPYNFMMTRHAQLLSEKKIRRKIENYDPDVIVSVHPAMQLIPHISSRKMSKAKGKHIPFFTVVTDLASGHATWFIRDMEKMYLASDSLYRKARRRGRTPPEKIVMSGLPIRHDFAIQADALGDRTTPEGLSYQMSKKTELGIDPNKPMILMMGGGEGVGSLAKISEELYASMTNRGIDATICVVCGRNEKLKSELAEKDWDTVAKGAQNTKKGFFRRLFRRRSHNKVIEESLERAANEEEETVQTKGKVDVVGLGFVTRMAEYMVAADVLVTKAGPGTIAEAAAVGLPVMLTSYIPGQEAGNVDFVLEKGFGDFSKDPVQIGEEVALWLQDKGLMKTMSENARKAGNPNAAAEIVLDIGSQTQTWMALNEAGASSS